MPIRHPPHAAETGAQTGQHQRRGVLATAWNAVCAAIGAVMGLLPHVLHHVGVLAGAALVTGAGGNLLFGAAGLALSIPMLRRLYRRFGTWKAPAIAVGVFTAMFAVSALVIGPAISGGDTGPTDVPSRTPSPSEHDSHHGG